MARILTLNIGATKVTVAEYALKGKRGLELSAYGNAELVGLDLEAEGNAQAVLAPAIREAMATAGVKPGPVNLSLGGQMVFPRFAKFPPVDEAKLEELVRYEVEQNVPFPPDEVVYDHQLTGETADGDLAAMVVAAKLDQVTAITDAVVSAGLEPKIVDAGPMAVYNALKNGYPELGGCNVVLDIGAKTTSLVLIENEKIYLRAIPVAGNAITREIATAFGCTPEEAEQLKREKGYVGLGGVTEDPDEIADRVSKIIRTVFTRLHAEISRSINFYRSQQGGSAPTHVFLTGGSAVIPQIDEFFTASLQVEVEFLNPFGRITFGPKLDTGALESDAFTLAESAGLAMRATDAAEMKMNLLPPQLVERARNRKRFPFIVAGGVFVLGALAVAAAAQNGLKAVAVSERETLEEHAAKLKNLDAKLKKEQKSAENEIVKCDGLRRLVSARLDRVLELDAVRRSLLPGMWIVSWTPAEGVTKVAVRGWSDALRALEKKHADAHGGRKTTAAELVKDALAKQAVLSGGGVKISAQGNVSGRSCLEEFTLDISFPPPAPLAGAPAEKDKGKGGKRK